MNSKNTFSHFGFIGFGLIGGSIAHALREIYPDSEIMAYNYYETKAHPKLEQAKADGVLSYISTNLTDFSKCDVIFLCAPVITNVKYLSKIKPYLSEDCVITDVGSVKSNIHDAIQHLGLEEHFVGGHPMAGSEKTGYDNSNSDLLKDAWYILTPTEKTPDRYTEWLKEFVMAIGAHCEIMDCHTHDEITAAISHCPHVISAALTNTVNFMDKTGRYTKLAAGGLKDITRISSSSPEMWQNICLTNQECIVDFLDEYIKILRDAQNAVANGDADKLIKFFSDAKNFRDRF